MLREQVLRSIYQDVPLYTLEEFKKLAPEAARTEDVFSDEHQLMLNRLSFELAERQRFGLLFITWFLVKLSAITDST